MRTAWLVIVGASLGGAHVAAADDEVVPPYPVALAERPLLLPDGLAEGAVELVTYRAAHSEATEVSSWLAATARVGVDIFELEAALRLPVHGLDTSQHLATRLAIRMTVREGFTLGGELEVEGPVEDNTLLPGVMAAYKGHSLGVALVASVHVWGMFRGPVSARWVEPRFAVQFQLDDRSTLEPSVSALYVTYNEFRSNDITTRVGLRGLIALRPWLDATGGVDWYPDREDMLAVTVGVAGRR